MSNLLRMPRDIFCIEERHEIGLIHFAFVLESCTFSKHISIAELGFGFHRSEGSLPHSAAANRSQDQPPHLIILSYL